MEKIYSVSSTLVRSVIAIVLGTILVVRPDMVNRTLIIILGVTLMIPLLVTLYIKIFNIVKQDTPTSFVPVIGSGASAVLGLLMVITPETFASLLAMLIGIMLLLAGISQILGVYPYCRAVKRYWLMLIPSITAILGIYTIVNFSTVLNVVWIIIGVIMIIYGLSDILNYFKLKSLTKITKETNKPKTDNIEEAEIIE